VHPSAHASCTETARISLRLSSNLQIHRSPSTLTVSGASAYAQGASAELVAAATIGAADMFGLPVSITHVLSSGVAGAMAANGSGLQLATIRNMVMAWVLTLPAAILISGALYVIFSRLF